MVIARYGCWHRNVEGPRARLERFGFVEWDYPVFGMETERAMVDAPRPLTESQANAIADLLRDSGDYADISISASPLSTFAADEGLLLTVNVQFAQVCAEQERLMGFPHFLSVWLDED